MKNKVLIISHNPIGDIDNIGITLRNLFSTFNKEELCQLFLRDQECNFDVCDNYYCFKETDILKSNFKKGNQTGYIKYSNEETTEDEVLLDNDKTNGFKNFIYEFGRKRTQYIYSARNYIWRHSNWYSRELKEWLSLQRPTVIFFCAGDYSFLFEIVETIAKDLNIPVISYYVDEYYFVKEKNEKLLHFDSKDYKKCFKRIYNLSKVNFCISESMSDVYSREFGKNAEILMNSVIPNELNTSYKLGDNVNVRYFGNISYGRSDSLSKLSSIFAKLNKENKRQLNFEVYSGETNNALIAEFKKNKDVNFMGCISSEEVSKEIAKSDILVVTESFDKDNRETVKHSVSTKIPDSLNSGKLILALGPNDVEAISYLKRNNAALVLDDLDKAESICAKLYGDIDVSAIIANANALINKNHDKKLNDKILRNALYENIRN